VRTRSLLIVGPGTGIGTEAVVLLQN